MTMSDVFICPHCIEQKIQSKIWLTESYQQLTDMSGDFWDEVGEYHKHAAKISGRWKCEAGHAGSVEMQLGTCQIQGCAGQITTYNVIAWDDTNTQKRHDKQMVGNDRK